MRIRCRSEMRALALSLAAAVLLVGCKPDDGKLEPVGESLMQLEQAACEKRGGEWKSDGSARFCLNRTRDGGQSCRTARDCESACLARSMTCAPVKPLVGCNEVITSGGLRVTECVD